ncbi:hypothetical protein WSM22_44920 [Cytophagales bacterium WSM2-2]|nr:hypothetical protein WSM22_44920 [Cytophagales bacterium WSM2-2]
MDIPLSDSDLIKILNSDDLYGIMQRVLLRENKIDRNREHFWVVGLEMNNRILFIEMISMGSVKETIAEPMEVFSLALQKRAVKIILVHNHPTGELSPSDADKNLTDRLIQVGMIVNTEVIDHLIIAEKSFMSFADTGLLAELKKSTKWVPAYELRKRWEKQAMEIGRRTERLEIARELKKRNIPVKEIAEITGLSEEEVEGIKK